MSISLKLFFILSLIFSNNLVAQEKKIIPKLARAVIIAEQLAGKLVIQNESSISPYKLNPEKAIDHFLFYYSAKWSPSCQKFTTQLKKFYVKAKTESKNFEIIFVSRDDSEKEMSEYMIKEKMPWPAIRFDQLNKLGFVNDAGGRGVPCISVLDSRGLILSHSYHNKSNYIGTKEPLEEFAKLIDFKWSDTDDNSQEAIKE
tara:strand:+ start:86 stop:688 length:603 start_codon:yes stop_codon:yes gene_type:complete